MAKQRLVLLDGGSDFTLIRASIPAHAMKVYQDGARDKVLVYKTPFDDFDATYTCKAGDPIQLVGHGRSGILAKPPNYAGENQPPLTAPAAGDSGGGRVALQVKFSDDADDTYVVVVESENEL